MKRLIWGELSFKAKLMSLLGGSLLFFCFVFIATFTAKLYHYRNSAIQFWGNQYHPEPPKNGLLPNSIGEFILPKGGSIIENSVHVCPNTKLKYVPIRVTEGKYLEVMCGFPNKDSIRTIHLDNELNNMVIEAIKTSAHI